jgi:putative acetyltransferase
MVTVRKAEEHDLDSIRELFKNCVMTVCRNDYSSDQLRVWSSAANNRERWTEKIESQFFLIAEREEMIVGFGSLEGLDTIDLLYVHPDFQRMGIADKLLSALLRKIKENGTNYVKADVSKTARPFFESRGFLVSQEQTVTRGGVSLMNYRMSANL